PDAAERAPRPAGEGPRGGTPHARPAQPRRAREAAQRALWIRDRPARMIRRDFLKLAAAGGTAALAARPLVSAHAQGPELVVGMSLDPGHLDPRVEAGGPGWSIFNHMFDGLVFRDDKTNPIPWLVTKWEQATPTVLRWHLRK